MMGRVYAATGLLIFGVALAGDPLWYWNMLGYLLLCFVPALVVDASTLQAKRLIRREARTAGWGNANREDRTEETS